MPKHIRISEAARILGMSEKTLRRWSESGKLIPKRSSGNQRFYTYGQLREFQSFSAKEPNPSTDIESRVSGNKYRISSISFVFVWSLLTSIAILGSAVAFDKTDLLFPQKIAEINPGKSAVLAASTATPPTLSSYTFNVNVPSVFSNDVTFQSNVTAPNIVNSIQGKNGNVIFSAGSGISLNGTTITNSDAGSSQKIFKTIKIGGDALEAGSNTDILEYVGTGGMTITADTGSKKLTFNSLKPDYTLSGWTRLNGYVYTTSLTDKIGIGTMSPAYSLDVVGNARFSESLLTNGINNLGGGITNAGAITGATGLTSSGQITFSNFSGGVLHSNFNGIISSSSVDLINDTSGVLAVNRGGTGITSFSVGDILYASSSGSFAKISLGSEGSSLVVSNGLPAWGTSGIGQTCTNCLVIDPGSTQTITPAGTAVTGLVIKQANGGTADIFSIKSFDGATNFLNIDSAGLLKIGNALSSYLGGIKTAALTDNRTYTFPDYSGNVCLDTGNCAGVGSNLGGSGTLNYLGRWSGPYSLETGSIFDNGNVGIGTANPLSKFQVVGDASISGALKLNSTLNTSGVVNFASTLGVTGATTLSSTLDVTGGITGGGNLNIGGTGNSYVMGKLGIGNNSPSYNLDIVGSTNTSDSYYLSGLLALSKSGNDLAINSSGNFVNTTIPGGNLGVGTTSPTAKLDVAANDVTTGTAANFSLDGLTTGIGLYVHSTSSANTSGQYVKIDQTQNHTSIEGVSNSLLALNRTLTYDPQGGSVVMDNMTEASSSGAAAASITFSHTTDSSSNRLLLVYVSLQDGAGFGPDVSSVKYNNVALTRSVCHASQWSVTTSCIYSMIAPPTGTYNIVVTATDGSATVHAGAISYHNVNQSTPIGATCTNVPCTLSGNYSGIVTDLLTSQGTSSLTAGADQTVIWNKDFGGQSGVSTKHGETSVTTTWTGYGNYPSHVAMAVSPAFTTNLSVSGALANISSNCSGSVLCGDTASLLNLSQLNSYASGSAITISNNGLGADITFNTSPILRMADGGTMVFDDGTNPLFKIIDKGTTSTASVSGTLTFAATTSSVDVLNGSAFNLKMSPGGDTGLTTRLTISTNGNMRLLGDNVNNTPTASIITARYWASDTNTRASSIFHYYNSSRNIDAMVFGVSGDTPGASNYGSPNQLSMAKMVIEEGGNVGVGTTAPTAKLDVAGDASTSASLVFRAPSPTIDILNGAALKFQTSPGGDTGLASKMTLLANGNLGIGTDSASYKLDVAGIIRSTAGLSTFVKAGEISDTDFTETPIDGLMAIDSTDNRLYVRSGGAWKYIAFTGGFQIPSYETGGLSTGDFLIPYVESSMNDGAVHGMYKKFSDVKENLLADIYDLIKNISDRVVSLETKITSLADKITTKESHQEKLCVGTDGNEVCLDKTQVEELVKTLPTSTPSATNSGTVATPSPAVAGEATPTAAPL